MFTWPAAPVLAHFIWKNKEHFKGKQVIEVEYYSKSASKFGIKQVNEDQAEVSSVSSSSERIITAV